MPDTDIPELPRSDGYRKLTGITIAWASFRLARSFLVMAGLRPGHPRLSFSASNKNVDARDEPGHDDPDGKACS
jgi:hypothetical protein